MAQRTDIRYVQYYTDGSTARKIALQKPIHIIKLPRFKKQKRVTIHIDPIAVASIAMAALMLVLMVVGVVRLHAARQEVQIMSAYVHTLREENEQLQKTFTEGYDLEQIQRTALALGLVDKDEVPHITIRLPAEQEPEEPGAWERLSTFLAGLFA